MARKALIGMALAGLGLAVAGLGLGAARSGPGAGVAAFSPAGSVAGPEQIAIRFNTAMVAMGDPRQPAPITGNCHGKAPGRWVDASSYVIDLPAPLPGGQRCQYALVPGLKDAAGAAVQGRLPAFDTGGPLLVALLPDGYGIAEDQMFLLALNATPTPASIAAHAACQVEGVGEQLPLDVQPMASRDAVLNGLKGDWALGRFLVAAGWRKDPYDAEARPRPRASIIAVKCRRALPGGARVSLVWGAGIASASGLVTGQPDRRIMTVRQPFLARLECSRSNAAAHCSPLENLALNFTGQVPLAQALAVRLVAPDGSRIAPEQPKGRREATLDGVRFKAPFQPLSRYRIEIPAGLADADGRPLTNAARFPLEVPMAEAPPLAKFAGSFGIIEAAEGGVLPVTLRGIEIPTRAAAASLPAKSLSVARDADIAAWLRRLDAHEEYDSAEVPLAGGETMRVQTTGARPLLTPAQVSQRFTLTRQTGSRAMEVVGIPLKAKGFHVVEIASPALGAALMAPGRVRYVATGALVTDMAVHFQWGLGRSLVWVTRLGDATPVARARVAISDSCNGKLLWQGSTDAQGRALVGDVLPQPSADGDCRYGQPPLFISARSGDDMSFTLTSWGRGIQPWDFNLPAGWGRQPLAAHLVLDRTLARPGDTLHGKLLLRTRTDAGLGAGPQLANPRLRFRHWESDTEFSVPLNAGLASWQVPASAPQGDYEVSVLSDGREPASVGQVQVAEFRLPAMRARISGPAQPAVAPASLPLDLSLTYLAGGGAAGTPVTVRTLVQPRSVTVPGREGWTFDAEDITPGIVPQAANGDGDDASAVRPATLRAQEVPHTLGPGGALRVLAGGWPAITRPSELVAEMDYADANGETATASRRIALEPAGLRVGLMRDGWMARAEDVRLRMLVLGLDNKPISGAKVTVRLFSRETYSTRKRLVGGFYAFDNATEVKELGQGCSARSDGLGLAQCQLAPGVSGEVIALAEVKDGAGRVARATQSLWLAGDDDWWFGGDNGDRMDVVAENPDVPAGGTARLQVRMPFRTATTLVTVLRDGVVDSFVTTLSGKDPVVEVPMKAGYAPNVYVEVLAVRGRISGWRLWLADLARRWNLPWLSRDGAYPTALVDLAKPSYRLGIAKLKVGWDQHRLAVQVKADQPAYPVRGRAMLAVQVAPPPGRALPADAEIAVAAVDEALLQLQPNDSWDALTKMMAERPLAVLNATAQSQVVGKRVYGRKAVAAGGGGGADLSGLTRRDFNPLLGWWGRVKLDRQGRASLPVPLNDSLSSFRLVAVATAGTDLFGMGATSIATRQPLQLLPGIPPVVREGDDYVAEIIARNTTARPLPVQLTGSMGAGKLPVLAITIPPGGAGTARWRVHAPAAGPVPWRVEARGGGQADAVQVAQQVLPAVPDHILMATLFQAGAAPIPMAPPAGALPGRGGVDVALSRTLGGQLAGVRAAMLAYPYDCIEQQLSRAVALGDRARWDRAAAALPGYLDGDGLVRFFPADWIAGDDELTSYILSLSAEAGWPLPDAARGKMLEGLARFVAGRLQRSHDNVLVVEKGGGAAVTSLSGDEAPRRVAALAALARHGAATPALAAGISALPDAWPTSTVLDWVTVLRVLPNPARLAQAEAVLRARLDVAGTTLRVNRADALWQLLASPDTTMAGYVMLASKSPGWAADAPRLARALMLAQRRGAWDSTMANALGTLAMRQFSQRFERGAVAGTTTASLGGASRQFRWPAGADPAPQSLPFARGLLAVQHQGSGAPWVVASTRAAVPITTPFQAGFTLARSTRMVAQAVPGRLSRGDVVEVTLTVAARAPVAWTVINDPVPAGATILGGTLGGRSTLLASEGSSGTPPSFVERRGDAIHAHYEALGRAPATFRYSYRLGSEGRFQLPPTRVEALYSPEMLALLPNAPLVVAARP